MRYIIGIDLGTTNSCVAYVDTKQPQMSIQQFPIYQLKEAGYVDALPTLPSFCYLASPHEWPHGVLDLPWKKNGNYFTGTFALSHGSKVTTRLVQSAKSWLSHQAANRRDKILPFEAVDESEKISPVEASKRYLSHIREAWNHGVAAGDPEAEFEQQEIILTVPASFDEVARTLTAEASRQAGFSHVTLLEEPQAAFYCWISRHEKRWKNVLYSGAVILVCDVGGGTTDFSLIEVTEKDQQLAFQRMAVGDHLLLGGDNMDAAIAYFLESKLRSKGYPECQPHQWAQLRHQARVAKESLFGENGAEVFRVQLLGTGSGVVQGSLSVDIERSELQQFLLAGFFNTCTWEEAIKLRKGSAIRSMGLPYEEEPSILKHMAAFLKRCGKRPDYVLFNGGTMKPQFFQDAVLNALYVWFPDKKLQVLPSDSLDLAVSRGAAYYGKARRGEGVQIGGGSARSYYLGLEIQGKEKAMTLLPRGAEEGSSYEPDQVFWLMANRPVTFKLYSSHVRLADVQGAIIAIDPLEMQPLPAIHTILRFGKGMSHETSKEKIPIHLGIALTPIGTLELWVKSRTTNHQWSLEFQLRTASGQDDSLALVRNARQDETLDETSLQASRTLISKLFSGSNEIKPGKIIDLLENQLQRPKGEWAPSILRDLGEEISLQVSKRMISLEHEARWWNLSGFFLRPGTGFPLDDFKIKDLWKTILADLGKNRPLETQIQSWICYRRIAGGLNKGQQMQLAHELLNSLFNSKTGNIDCRNKGELYQYHEKIRALAAMELIDINIKIRLGNALIKRIQSGSASSVDFWALARLGARHLLYGGMSNIVPREICTRWIETLLQIKQANQEDIFFTISHLARKTDTRELNILSPTVDRILQHYTEDTHQEQLKKILFEVNQLTAQEQEHAFGERLPLGISL